MRIRTGVEVESWLIVGSEDTPLALEPAEVSTAVGSTTLAAGIDVFSIVGVELPAV